MKRFFCDFKKYWSYAKYAAKSDLNSEIAGSHLGWLWWVLDPLLFMLIYSFVAGVVFKKSETYLAAFIFLGLSCYDFFQKTLKQSVRLVAGNSAIISKIYLPKYMLIVQVMLVNAFKMLVSLLLVCGMMFIYRVPLTYRALYSIPLFALLFIITFGASTIILHYGVFFEDLANILSAVLRMLFYFSGVFYSIEKRVPGIYGVILLRCNPIALIMDGMRKCVLYGKDPNFGFMGAWFVTGIILAIIGVCVIYKYENTYAKVI